jgi:NADH-quinone oxidoreductase subunit N
MLVPFAVGASGSAAVRHEAFQAVLVYLLIYSFTNLGAFAVVTLVNQGQPGNLIADYAGLARRAPALGFAMTVFLLSLAGFPLTAGFFAKVVVFKAAINGGQAGLYVLVAAMAVLTVVAFFYYMNIARLLWLGQPPEGAPTEAPPLSPLLGVAIGLSLLGVLVLGVLPNLLVQYAPLSTLVASK